MLTDKQKHLLVGRLTGIATLPIALIQSVGFWWALLITFVVGTFAFVGKELYDVYKPRPTGFDRIDLTTDYIGYAQTAIISYLLYHGWQIYLTF